MSAAIALVAAKTAASAAIVFFILFSLVDESIING
jgi:hypothetical protein